MKRLFFFITIFALWLSQSGCSWVEYFTVSNLSNQTVYINYTLSPLSEGKSFGIFDKSPVFYETTNKGRINWDKKITKEITIENENTISMELPPKTIMIFGRLNNDNYKSYDQYFINGREFNLDFMEIEVNLEVMHIDKSTFDKNFKKLKGYIKYEVK